MREKPPRTLSLRFKPRAGVKPVALALLAFALIIGGEWGAREGHWRINISGSLPGTFYRVTGNRNPRVGDFVTFCPPVVVPALADANPWEPSCAGKVPLIKEVAAVAGDRVVVSERGVSINGRLWPESRPKTRGMDGRPLPSAVGVYTLRPGEIWVMGEHPDSYDSRYYGPITVRAIK